MYGTFYASNDYRFYLAHHGIKGQKWGVRRFQNADGSYNSAGKKRYGIGDGESYEGVKSSGQKSGAVNRTKAQNRAPKKQLTPEEKAARNARIKKVAAAVAGTAAVAAGTYFAAKYLKNAQGRADQLLSERAELRVKAYINNMTFAKNESKAWGSQAQRYKEQYHKLAKDPGANESKKKLALLAFDKADAFAKAEGRNAERLSKNAVGNLANIRGVSTDRRARVAAAGAVVRNDIHNAAQKARNKVTKSNSYLDYTNRDIDRIVNRRAGVDIRSGKYNAKKRYKWNPN